MDKIQQLIEKYSTLKCWDFLYKKCSDEFEKQQIIKIENIVKDGSVIGINEYKVVKIITDKWDKVYISPLIVQDINKYLLNIPNG
jgi:hypothetical protein